MKGKTNTGVVISETETLVAGTEVEIVDIRYGCETCYMCIIPSGISIPIDARIVDITDHTPFMDWNKLRVEFAGRAMQGILSGTNNPTIVIDTKSAVKSAVIYADTLIEELKKR
ncbi:hypothetical protein [uncultured Bacteroides sp.]|uniref:hypothetical protein n=1 Tax=uncultured Bacteroides sp. TaxID=162156 RepID=UPI0025957DBE|nr:hypothetical protein [uncultured Bacteroides sp.]